MSIKENHSLRYLNTFGVDQTARYFIELYQINELPELLRHFKQPHILGGGSNILLTRDLDGLVIHNRLQGITQVDETEEDVRVEIYSGENWHQFVQWAVRRGLGGVENLSLIPGTVGAAPIQNIGAYGVEIKDVLERVEVMDLHTSELSWLNVDQCQLGYRHSLFKLPAYKGRYFISRVTLRLSKHPVVNTRYADVEKKLKESSIDHPGIAEIHQAIIEIRQNKLPDPSSMGNAGSFFKNPIVSTDQFQEIKNQYPLVPHYPAGDEHVKIPAGWLIDQAGWKGRTLGRVGCYEKQALVIVNKGGAGGQEIQAFSGMIQEDIYKKFKITLEPEINIW